MSRRNAEFGMQNAERRRPPCFRSAFCIATSAFVSFWFLSVAAAQDVENHPTLPSNTNWIPILLLLIGLLGFLAAAVIGPIVRLNMSEELPVTQSHDEPPGSSHHHGRSGVENPAAESNP
jgi:hypothetical protein